MYITIPPFKPGIPLATRSGKKIENEQRYDRHPSAMQEAVKIWLTQFPNITPRSLTAIYDCMGLVFASRRTWIDISLINFILHEDGYHQINITNVELGDIIIYRNINTITHVGIIIEKKPSIEPAKWNIRVMSQWGADGEYIHSSADIPHLYGVDAEYWTDRKQ